MIPPETGGWTAVPRWIVRDKAMSEHAKMLLIVLSSYVADPKTEPAWPSHATLSQFCRVSPATVKRGLLELRDAGLVTWETRVTDDGSQTSNLYRLHLTDPLGHTDQGGGSP